MLSCLETISIFHLIVGGSVETPFENVILVINLYIYVFEHIWLNRALAIGQSDGCVSRNWREKRTQKCPITIILFFLYWQYLHKNIVGHWNRVSQVQWHLSWLPGEPQRVRSHIRNQWLMLGDGRRNWKFYQNIVRHCLHCYGQYVRQGF